MASIDIIELKKTDTGERFYPLTHVDAVIGLSDRDFFEKYTNDNGETWSVRLKPGYTGLWTEGFMSAGGLNANAGGGGGGVSNLWALNDVKHGSTGVLRSDGVTPVQAGDILVYGVIDDTTNPDTYGWYAKPENSAGGGGTVTSVGLQAASGSGLSVSGSPITGSGTFTIGIDSSHYLPLATDKAAWDAKQDLIDASHKLDYSLIANTPTIPTVSWSQLLQTGFRIASVTINGTTTNIYAPEGNISSVVGDLNTYETIFARNIVLGKNIREDGQVLTDPDRCYLDYTPCFPGATIKYQSESDNSLVSAVAFYDSNKVYISSLVNTGTRTDLHTAVAPANAYYVRLCTYQSEVGNLQYYCNGYVAHLSEEIDGVKDELFELENDVSNYEMVNYMSFADTFVNTIYANDGTLVANADENCTTLVPLDREQDLYCGTDGYAEAVFFDATKTFISKTSFWIYGNISKSNFPSNARYVAFNYYRSSVMGDNGFYAGTRYALFCPGLYPFQKKVKNSRPIINIYTSDSQEQIFIKLVNAWYLQDCDVYFEFGTYQFSTIFDLMKSKYLWYSAYELPLGGNCRYYLNGSTIIGSSVSSDQDVYENASVFGTHRMGEYNNSFELIDGIIEGNGTIYTIHDECNGGSFRYKHTYKNLLVRYNTSTHTVAASCPIGAGTGLNGAWEINGCIFENNNSGSDNDIFIHGHSKTSSSDFRLNIANTYFSKKLSLLALSGNAQKGTALLSGCSFVAHPTQNAGWTIYETTNTIR